MTTTVPQVRSTADLLASIEQGYQPRFQGFDEQTWNDARFEIVVRGNLAKFSQNPPLARFLSQTGDRVLVEASPVDAIWGIGLAATDPEATTPRHWRGLNLLGFALMEVRAALALAPPMS